MSTSETLIEAKGVSKKFARRLRSSLWYGLKDIGSEICFAQNKDRNLRKHEFWALKDISLSLKRGEVISLIGSNGAGKTTLLRLIDGLIKPDQGHIAVRGRIGALISLGTGFNPVLTGRENLYVNAAVLGIQKHEVQKKFDQIVSFAGLEDAIDTPVQYYSSGMVVRLGFSIGIHLEPDILLVDEVLSVGDLAFNQKSLKKSLELVKKRTCGILFVSHKLWTVQQISTKVIWIENGHVKHYGPPQEVLSLYQKQMSQKEISIHNSEVKNVDCVARYGYLGKHIYFEGEPDAAIGAVKLKNQQGQFSTAFKSSEAMVIEFDVEFKRKLMKPMLVMRLLRNDGTNVWYYMVPQDIDLRPGKKTKVVLKAPQVQLVSGSYLLSVRLLDQVGAVTCAEPVEINVQSEEHIIQPNLSIYEPKIDVVLCETT